MGKDKKNVNYNKQKATVFYKNQYNYTYKRAMASYNNIIIENYYK